MVTGTAPGRAKRGEYDATLVGMRVGCLLLALLACVPGLIQLDFIWKRSDYLGHAYLIPFTAIFLAYSKRAELRSAFHCGKGARFGPLAVLFASAILAIGVLAHSASIAGIGIPLLLGTTAYATSDSRFARACLPSLLFLLLMVPPPPVVQDQLLFGLKAVVVSASVGLLQTLGFSIAAVGNRIFVPQSELLVADACSGLTSVVTLAPLAVVVAYFLARGVWRRALIVLAAVPIAIAGNILRVVVTVVLVSHYGPEYAEGLVHESFGLATFVLGTVCLLGLVRVLR
jgi:exosortase